METDGEDVVAVTLVGRASSVEAPGTRPDVWLGPTLGDPMAAAVSLPGARVVTEDPRGDDGPGVTSVVVDTTVGQVVLADPPFDQATRSEGRITHITVRQDEAVQCRRFDDIVQVQPGQVIDPDAPVATFDDTGTTDVRLGDPVADAERAGLVRPRTDPPAPGTVPERLAGCDAWTTTDGTDTVVLADQAGRVVAVGSGGDGVGFSSTFGLSPGQPADDAAALLGTEPPPAMLGDDLAVDGVPFEGEVAPGVLVTAVSYPSWLPITTIDALLTGPLLLTGLTVHLQDDASAPPC